MKIVVGIDGSSGARTALRWALAEARAHGATVHAVHAWQMPTAASALGMPLQVPSYGEMKGAAKALLHEEMEMLGHEYDEVTVVPEILEGHPPAVLEAISGDADLLVLGSRGHGSLTSLVLGSVSQHCAHHARCPVVIIPPARAPRAEH